MTYVFALVAYKTEKNIFLKYIYIEIRTNVLMYLPDVRVNVT